MATLQGGKEGTYVRIDSIRSLSSNLRGDVHFVDKDGADFLIMSDVLAHLLSVVGRDLQCETVADLVHKLCSCPTNPP